MVVNNARKLAHISLSYLHIPPARNESCGAAVCLDFACRNDELEAAWDLYTPVLHELEHSRLTPEMYPYGSRGPLGAHYL